MVNATRKRLAPFIGKRDALKRIIIAPMTRLPFQDGSFNIVIANGVYHNTGSLNEFIEAIQETGRILKNDGFLCINVFYRGVVAPELRRIRDNSCVFITKERLRLTLLTKNTILKSLKKSSLFPIENVITYDRNVSTGLRSVLRGICRKSRMFF